MQRAIISLDNIIKVKQLNRGDKLYHYTTIRGVKDILDFIQDKDISDTDKNNALKQIIAKIVYIKPEKHLEIIYY